MADYIHTSDGELQHYGVPGMKWGKKKAQSERLITTYQAVRNATKAAGEARKKSISESRASGPKGIGSFQKANRKALNAKRKAYRESMAADREHNRKLRTVDKDVNFNIRNKAYSSLKKGKVDKYDTVVGKTGRRFVLNNKGELRQIDLSYSDAKKLAKRYNKKVSELLKKNGSNVLREPVILD